MSLFHWELYTSSDEWTTNYLMALTMLNIYSIVNQIAQLINNLGVMSVCSYILTVICQTALLAIWLTSEGFNYFITNLINIAITKRQYKLNDECN